MANRQNKFLIKRSNVAGKIPTTGDLALGEMALNTADVILYTSGTTANTILPIGWDRIHRTGDTMTGTLFAPSVSATTISETTFYGDGSNLTGLNNRQILDVYQSGTTTTAGAAYSDIPWDSIIIVDTDYTQSGAEITFNTMGYYSVIYSITMDAASGGRQTSRTRLVIDTGGGYSELARTGASGYHRNTTQGQGTTTKTIRQLFTAGDKIKAQLSRLTGGGTLVTIAGDSNITINKIPSE